MKTKTFTIRNYKKESFLIGDSKQFGQNQVLSDTIKYNKLGLYDEQNQKRINKAKQIASRDGFTNIRVVTCFYDAVCTSFGVIDYKKTKEIEKAYKF